MISHPGRSRVNSFPASSRASGYRIPMNTILAFFFTAIIVVACSGRPIVPQDQPEATPSASGCTACHTDVSELLSQNHPAVSRNDLPACLACHTSMKSQSSAPNEFSATLHRAHAGTESATECTICHSWVPDHHFGIHGSEVVFGTVAEKDMALLKQTMSSWAGSPYLDSRHAKSNVTCRGCHGNVLPVRGDTVENQKCLSCHGSYDTLVEKTAPAIFPDRNPHKSHLGEIDCTVCHFAHSDSKVYCLECHPKFLMEIPGATPQK